MRLRNCRSEGGNMAKCERCGKKLTFRNNYGGICEECYDKRLRERKINNAVIYEQDERKKSNRKNC